MKIKRSFSTWLLLAISLSIAKAQSISADTSTNPVAPNPSRAFPIPSFKNISLGRAIHLTIAGQFREMYQHYYNEKWGDIPPSWIDKDGFYWHRIIVSGDLQFGKKVNVYSELTSSLVSSRAGGKRPSIDYDELGFSQLYLQVTAFQNPRASLKIKAGRQMYYFGSQRLITTREGPNNRLSFNGTTAVYQTNAFTLTSFIAQPIYNKYYVFDDSVVKSQTLWGVNLAFHQPGKVLKGEVYYYGYSNSSIKLAGVSGKDIRHSLGLFLTAGLNGWRFEAEPVLQIGKFNSKTAFGYSFFLKGQNTFLINKLVVVPGLSLAAFSGNGTSNGSSFMTYNPMYPKPPFGLIAPLGPVNLLDCNPVIQIAAKNAWQFYISSDIFWRESHADGLYTPAMGPAIQQIYPADKANKSFSRFIGNDYVADINHKLTSYLSVDFLGGYFIAGDYLKQTGKGKNITYLSGIINIQF